MKHFKLERKLDWKFQTTDWNYATLFLVLSGESIKGCQTLCMPFHSRFLQYDLSVFNPFGNLPKALRRLGFSWNLNQTFSCWNWTASASVGRQMALSWKPNHLKKKRRIWNAITESERSGFDWFASEWHLVTGCRVSADVNHLIVSHHFAIKWIVTWIRGRLWDHLWILMKNLKWNPPVRDWHPMKWKRLVECPAHFVVFWRRRPVGSKCGAWLSSRAIH